MFSHYRKNILDLVFTTKLDIIQDTQVGIGMSDHDALITYMNLTINPPKRRKRTVYIFRKTKLAQIESRLDRLYQFMTD